MDGLKAKWEEIYAGLVKRRVGKERVRQQSSESGQVMLHLKSAHPRPPTPPRPSLLASPLRDTRGMSGWKLGSVDGGRCLDGDWTTA